MAKPCTGWYSTPWCALNILQCNQVRAHPVWGWACIAQTAVALRGELLAGPSPVSSVVVCYSSIYAVSSNSKTLVRLQDNQPHSLCAPAQPLAPAQELHWRLAFGRAIQRLSRLTCAERERWETWILSPSCTQLKQSGWEIQIRPDIPRTAGHSCSALGARGRSQGLH